MERAEFWLAYAAIPHIRTHARIAAEPGLLIVARENAHSLTQLPRRLPMRGSKAAYKSILRVIMGADNQAARVIARMDADKALAVWARVTLAPRFPIARSPGLKPPYPPAQPFRVLRVSD
jgi:hypothetical protein